MNWSKSTTSIASSENLQGVAKVIFRYVDGVGIRITMHSISKYGQGHQYLQDFAKYSNIPVINMADDKFHPCQGLADIMGWSEYFSSKTDIKSLRGKTLLLTSGSSGFARPWASVQSHLLLASRVGMNIRLAYPIGYELDTEVCELAKLNCQINNTSYEEIHDPDVGYDGAGNYWCKDKNGVYTEASLKLAEMLGITPSDIIGKTDFEMSWKNEAAILVFHDNLVMSRSITVTREEKVTSNNGDMLTFLVTKSPLKDSQGNIIGTVGTSVDINELKKTQQELVMAKQKAEAASQSKSEFIANMSHDIRTPITGMLGLVQGMINAANEAQASLQKRHEPIEHAQSQSNASFNNLIAKMQTDGELLMGATDELLQLCNEILEVVRLESGESTHQSESFNLHDIVEHNIELFQPTAHHKNLQLSYSIDPNVPDYLNGSRLYLTRVLLNLMSNALKFTQAGTVKVSAEALDSSGGDVKVGETITIRILVEDTGIGIPKDKFDTIFEHFSRLTPSYEGSYPGAGLGLYTVKRYIEAMQGSIDVSSELNKGTCFTVTVPLTVSDHADRVKQSVRHSKLTQPCVDKKAFAHQGTISTEDAAASILVVEDNQLAAIAIKLALKPFHCHVETAESGSQAVKMAQQGQYDLILMDVGLPDFSGIEATKKIRKLNDAHKSQVPIVALTGHANNPEVREEALEAGMQEVLSKPAQPLALECVLQDYVFQVNEKKQPQPATSDACDESSTSSVVIDWDGCVRMCNGDAEQARHMLSLLDKDLTELTVIVAHAYAKRDTKTLREALHRTRGGVCYLKVPQLEHALNALHEAIKELPQHRERLEKSYTALQQAIAHFKTSWAKILKE